MNHSWKWTTQIAGNEHPHAKPIRLRAVDMEILKTTPPAKHTHAQQMQLTSFRAGVDLHKNTLRTAVKLRGCKVMLDSESNTRTGCLLKIPYNMKTDFLEQVLKLKKKKNKKERKKKKKEKKHSRKPCKRLSHLDKPHILVTGTPRTVFQEL